jgi:methylenetetrahydrofolate reductase (NADPH)
MGNDKTALRARIDSSGSLLLAEISPPKGSDPERVRAVAKKFSGKVHALGVSDSRDGVSMSAVAAAALVAQEGVEPVLHLTTRDRNRIALISDSLGAAALGVRNILLTSGTHQTLGPARAARGVFDVDSVQLLSALAGLGSSAALVGEAGLNGAGSYCLGAVAAPFADPLELQVSRVGKKIGAGAQFLITQSVFDVERFEGWWREVVRRGLHKKAAFVAGIRILASADEAKGLSTRRPVPRIPLAVLDRLSTKSGRAQRSEGIAVAVETGRKLASLEGLRGFAIRADRDEDAALEVIAQMGQGIA